MKLISLVQYIDELLEVSNIQDYCPNGLQVEASEEISTIVTGVTASQALIEAASARKADLLLVHHGYFWRGEPSPLVGIKGRRVRQLFENRMSMAAYHLPLDMHAVYGNNITLAKRLGLEHCSFPKTTEAQSLVMTGELPHAMTASQFASLIDERLGRGPLLVEGGEQLVKRLALCTGGAQNMIDSVLALGVDAYISGEISEKTTHIARESGVHYFACGHHATERYGIQSLGEHLASKFNLTHHFIDIDNPA